MALKPSPDPMQVVAHNLRRLRLDANLSQAELADRAGLDRTFVSLCERCHRNVTVESLFALAKGLGREPADLVASVPLWAELIPGDARADTTLRVRVPHHPVEALTFGKPLRARTRRPR